MKLCVRICKSVSTFQLLLIIANAPLPAIQLPAGGLQQQQQNLSNCADPLRFIAPDTRCEGPTAYLMSASADFGDCPARSVCLSSAENAACSDNLLAAVGKPNDCPSSSPLHLLEYYPPSIETERELFSAPRCPVRTRCVPLRCFDDFCRAKRPDKTRRDPTKVMSPSFNRPALVRSDSNQCEYLQCGCSFTEADLLADGCPTPGELLMLRADPVNGCPAKLCVAKLPIYLEPLLSPAIKDAAKKQVDCTSQAANCPPNTSELTVPNPEPGECPLRICLLPELLDSDATSTAAPVSITSSSSSSVLSTGTSVKSPTETTSSEASTWTEKGFFTTSATDEASTAKTTVATTSSSAELAKANTPSGQTADNISSDGRTMWTTLSTPTDPVNEDASSSTTSIPPGVNSFNNSRT